MWMRILLGEKKATTVPGSTYADGRGPASGYKSGETEDYLLNSAALSLTTGSDPQEDASGLLTEIPFEQITDEDQSPESEESGEGEETQRYKVYIPIIVQ